MRATKGDLPAPLLARIQSGGSVKLNPPHWIDAIGESLSVLFNTHLGSAATRQDYGLPEFHPDEMTGLPQLQYKANEVAALIQKFEPRLKQVRVVARLDDEVTGRAIFEVQGLLDDAGSGGRVSYHTVITGHGRVWLRK